jgi:lysophospholipase L1-like esterase
MATPFVYTALGDSLTYGTGACNAQGFVRRIYSRIAQLHPDAVTLHQRGTVGATTAELLTQVRKDATLREQLKAADLITITAGGNDIIQAAQKMYLDGVLTSMKPAMKLFYNTYTQLLEEVMQLVDSQETRVILLEIYNPLPMFRDAVLWVNFLNRYIARAAAPHGERVRVTRIYPAFLNREDELLADDGVHPNCFGHEVLARCVEETMYGTASG